MQNQGEGHTQLPEEIEFIQFCLENYKYNHCIEGRSIQRIETDLRLIKVIKRQLSIFISSGTINSPLLLNNTITLFNCFDEEAAQIILLYKMRSDVHRSCMKSVLLFLMKLNDIDHFSDVTHDNELFALLLKKNPQHSKKLYDFVF
jgi:hypothetical protein